MYKWPGKLKSNCALAQLWFLVLYRSSSLGSRPKGIIPLSSVFTEILIIFGCRNNRKLVYQMPGRLVGLTKTSEGPPERGFVLTLSPREQHIRREKATSNICSNQALMAVTAAIHTSLLGKSGYRQLGESILYTANYAAKRLNDIKGVRAPAIGEAIWKEFVVQFEDSITAEQVHSKLLEHDFHGGKILTKEFPELKESILFCFTEIHDKASIDELVDTVRSIVEGGN
jgi:glycine dehydrogenase subunit 1